MQGGVSRSGLTAARHPVCPKFMGCVRDWIRVVKECKTQERTRHATAYPKAEEHGIEKKVGCSRAHAKHTSAPRSAA